MLPGSESRDLFDSFEFLIGFYLFSFRVHKKVCNRRVHRTIQSTVHMTIIGQFPVTLTRNSGCWRDSGSRFCLVINEKKKRNHELKKDLIKRLILHT